VGAVARLTRSRPQSKKQIARMLMAMAGLLEE